jgi:hypothetical protein
LFLTRSLGCDIDLGRFRGPTLKLAYRLAEPAPDFGQLFATKDDESDDQDNEQFLKT